MLAPQPPAPVRRTRLVRDLSVAERFGLHLGEMYRVAYLAGGTQTPRVSRSLAMFEGISERRRWDGETTRCLDFTLPQGRSLSLLASQLVDARPGTVDERGRWTMLSTADGSRRRGGRRRLPG